MYKIILKKFPNIINTKYTLKYILFSFYITWEVQRKLILSHVKLIKFRFACSTLSNNFFIKISNS